VDAAQGIDQPATAKVPRWAIPAEIARDFLLSYVVARLLTHLTANKRKSVTWFRLWLWIGSPVTRLSGSVMWQGMSWKVAATHAGTGW
jgi:hypothetical protein